MEKLFPYQGHNVEDYFEKVFLSQRLHLSKPDARIYEEVIRQAAIVPEESLFIDDLRRIVSLRKTSAFIHSRMLSLMIGSTWNYRKLF